MVTFGHCHDITPLLTSLALSKGFDVCVTEGMVIVGVVVADPTDLSHFALTVGNIAVDLIMSPQAA